MSPVFAASGLDELCLSCLAQIAALISMNSEHTHLLVTSHMRQYILKSPISSFCRFTYDKNDNMHIKHLNTFK